MRDQIKLMEQIDRKLSRILDILESTPQKESEVDPSDLCNMAELSKILKISSRTLFRIKDEIPQLPTNIQRKYIISRAKVWWISRNSQLTQK